MSDLNIHLITIAESADAAARVAVETFTQQPNPFDMGTADYMEWHKRYCVALVRHSTAKECEVSA
jgi:hypothetical protein